MLWNVVCSFLHIPVNVKSISPICSDLAKWRFLFRTSNAHLLLLSGKNKKNIRHKNHNIRLSPHKSNASGRPKTIFLNFPPNTDTPPSRSRSSFGQFEPPLPALMLSAADFDAIESAADFCLLLNLILVWIFRAKKQHRRYRPILGAAMMWMPQWSLFFRTQKACGQYIIIYIILNIWIWVPKVMVPPLMWKLSHVAVLSVLSGSLELPMLQFSRVACLTHQQCQKIQGEMKVFRQGNGVPFLIQLVEVSDSAHTCKERSKSNCKLRPCSKKCISLTE